MLKRDFQGICFSLETSGTKNEPGLDKKHLEKQEVGLGGPWSYLVRVLLSYLRISLDQFCSFHHAYSSSDT